MVEGEFLSTQPELDERADPFNQTQHFHHGQAVINRGFHPEPLGLTSCPPIADLGFCTCKGIAQFNARPERGSQFLLGQGRKGRGAMVDRQARYILVMVLGAWLLASAELRRPRVQALHRNCPRSDVQFSLRQCTGFRRRKLQQLAGHRGISWWASRGLDTQNRSSLDCQPRDRTLAPRHFSRRSRTQPEPICAVVGADLWPARASDGA